MDGPDLSRVSSDALARIEAGEDPQTVITADAERQYGVRPGLVGAILTRGERSAYNATSPKGAAGAAQLMPGTARDLGVDAHDPVGSIYGAAQYTRQNLDRFNGDERLAVAAYNAGPGAVQRHGGVPPYAETRDYVHRVLGPDGSPTPDSSALPDVSHLTPAQQAALENGDMSVLGHAQGGGAPAAASPSVQTRPETVNDPDGLMSSADVPTAVSAAYRGLSVNRQAALGSRDNPRVNWSGSGRPSAPGEWVVDEGGLHQVLTPEQQKAQVDAQHDIGQAISTDADRAMQKVWSGFTLGGGNQLAALATAGRVGFDNLTGHGRGYGMQDAYQAQLRAEDASEHGYDESHPYTSGALSLAGSLVNPLSLVGGEVVAGAKTLPAIMARSAAVGAGVGGVSGAVSNEGGIADRALAGLEGAAGGGALGAALPFAGAVIGGTLKRGGSAMSETAQRLLGLFGRDGAEPTAAAVAKAAPEATDYVQSLVDRAKPGALNNPDLEAAGGTAAEALGRPAMTQLGAVARRDGQSGDLVEGLLRQRAEAMPADVVDDFHSVTGLDPAAMAGNHAQQAAVLRDKAAPLYDYAFSDPRGVSSTKLDDLARRPVVQDAMRRANTIARNEGRDPEGLFITDVQAPPPEPPGAAPDGDTPSFMDTLNTVRSGRVPKSNQGLSLLQYMSRGGGVNDAGGELRSLDADKWHLGRPGWRKLIQPTGDTLEGWGQRAWEAGYFPERTEAPDENGMIEASWRELAGKPRYAVEPDAKTSTARGAAQSMEEQLARMGIDPAKASDGEIAEALNPIEGGRHPYAPPDMEPVNDTAPTLQSWDDVKRALDDTVESYRDGTTRKLNLDNEGRAAVGTLKQLRDELVRLRPEYGDALAAGGEPLRLEQAFNDAKSLTRNTVPERVFNARWNTLGPAETDGFRGGFLNGVYEDMRAGRLRIRDMQSPAFKAKLETMFPGKADALNTRLTTRTLLARTGGRMMPGAGSPTMEYSTAEADRAAAMGALAGAAGKAAKGDLGGAVLKFVGPPVMGAIHGAQAPIDRATRDTVGRLLASPPSELDAVLAAAKARAAARPRLATQARSVGRLAQANAAGFLGSGPARRQR